MQVHKFAPFTSETWPIFLQDYIRRSIPEDSRIQLILRGSDDGVLQTGLLIFWTFSIVWYSKKIHNFSKTGFVFVLGCRKEGHLHSWVRLKELTSSLHLKTETDPVFQTMCIFLEFQTMDKVQKLSDPVIFSLIIIPSYLGVCSDLLYCVYNLYINRPI
jgi:hypothetical protein